MKFAVTVLGSGSAKPTPERLTSAHVLNVHEHFFLIDCGEGAQVAMMKFGIEMMKINHVFISHLHGDHYFGLPGVINSMHLFGRKRELHIYCFEELEQIIDVQLKAAGTVLSYPLRFHFLSTDNEKNILDNKYVNVLSFPLKHRIRTCGFLFREKKSSRNIRKEFVEQHKIPHEWFPRILAGEDFIDENGKRHPNNTITKVSMPSRSYAYCSDTAYDESIVPHIKNASLLYHEASFADDHEETATQKFHSTSRQAAKIAQLANAQQLMIGHFSNRYKTSDDIIKQAREEFNNTIEAIDGLTIEIVS